MVLVYENGMVKLLPSPSESEAARVREMIEVGYPSLIYLGLWALDRDRNEPYYVFYQPEPDRSKGHSHFPAFFVQDGSIMVTNGASVIEQRFPAFVNRREAIVTRFQRDFVTHPYGECFLDGGIGYSQRSGGVGPNAWVTLTEKGPRLWMDLM